MKRSIRCIVIAAVLAVTIAMTAWAAQTKIDKVRVEFSYVDQPKAGESIGDVGAKADSQEYSVVSAEYVNDDETWKLGDRPLVKVELSAKSGYRFSYTSKSHFSLSGCGAVFQRAKIFDDGETMELSVYFKRVGGKLGMVENLEWMGNTAIWDKLEGAKSYEVRLYRDDKLKTTVKTDDSSYNFSGYFDKTGTYHFRVRAISNYNGSAGEWSDDSEYQDIDVNYGQGWNQGSGGQAAGNRWYQNQYGWWYAYGGGGYPRNCWQNIGNVWYYFNSDGYMATGWQQVNGIWYYLSGSGAMQTGWQYVNGVWYYLNGSGMMLTGWQYINGAWYYMNGSGMMLTGWQYVNGAWYYMNGSGMMLTGWQYINGAWYYMNGSGMMLTGWQYINETWYYMNGSGAMQTGWQYVNGRWYYMDGSGAMYADRRTPDGYYVDGSGAWVR